MKNFILILVLLLAASLYTIIKGSDKEVETNIEAFITQEKCDELILETLYGRRIDENTPHK